MQRQHYENNIRSLISKIFWQRRHDENKILVYLQYFGTVNVAPMSMYYENYQNNIQVWIKPACMVQT